MATEPSLDALRARIGELEAALGRCARLNCAKPPVGKHWKDSKYCNDCTSCLARKVLAGKSPK